MTKEFVDGLFVNRRENAPEFVKASLSFKVENFADYLKSKANARGYVNIDILESKEGKLYAKLNDWKPELRATDEQVADNYSGEESDEIKLAEIPF